MSPADAISPRSRVTFMAALGVVGALPSLVWAASGAALMHDDWWLADAFAGGSVSERWNSFFEAATVAPARPGAALYYLISYGAFGRNAALHALLLAAVNAVLCILVFVVAERFWRTQIALWIAGFYAVMPNRGSTRLWFAVGSYTFALVLVLIGVLLVFRGRALASGLVLGLAVITYEGVVGLCLLAIAAWFLGDPRERWRKTMVALTPVLVGGLLLYYASPKRDSSTTSGPGGLDRMLASQFGGGTFEWPLLGSVAFLGALIGLVVVVAWRGSWQETYRPVMLWGLAILVAGWLPFMAINWPVGTDGFFDRANGVIGLGVAVIFGGLLALLAERMPAHIGVAVGGGLLAVLLALNGKDVRSYLDAREQGRTLLAQVLEDVPPTSSPVLIVPPPTGFNGVDQFVFGSNLSMAVEQERGDLLLLWRDPSVESAPLPEDHLCYSTVTRVLGPCEDDVPAG